MTTRKLYECKGVVRVNEDAPTRELLCWRDKKPCTTNCAALVISSAGFHCQALPNIHTVGVHANAND